MNFESGSLGICARSAALTIDTVVIDSQLPLELRKNGIRSTADHLRRASPQSRQPPDLRRGSIGPEAPAIGAAILPLHLNFTPNSSEMPVGIADRILVMREGIIETRDRRVTA